MTINRTKSVCIALGLLCIICPFKVPVRSNFPKFMFVDFSKVYVAVTHQAKPFFNPSTRSPFFFHGISRILGPPLIGHVPTAQ